LNKIFLPSPIGEFEKIIALDHPDFERDCPVNARGAGQRLVLTFLDQSSTTGFSVFRPF